MPKFLVSYAYGPMCATLSQLTLMNAVVDEQHLPTNEDSVAALEYHYLQLHGLEESASIHLIAISRLG